MKKGIGRLFLLGLSLVIFFLYPGFVSRAASGRIPTNEKKEYRVKNRAENDACLLSAASSHSHETEQETVFYVTGEGYMPEGSILAVYFGDRVEYSSTVTERKAETTVRFAVRWKNEESGNIGNEPGQEGGSQGGETESRYWRLGDEIYRKIHGETYRFVCIDEDYRGTEEGTQAALFLCDRVIPPDQADAIRTFGTSSSYKTSSIRKWLEEAQFEEGLLVHTGADHCYMGQTEEGKWEHTTEEGLKKAYGGYQRMTDRLFLLSVEEALSYGKWLWRFEEAMGKKEEQENPDSQLLGIQKAYWLRTPMGDGSGEDSGQVYVVDLLTGNIRPERAGAENAGVRPAFALSQ